MANSLCLVFGGSEGNAKRTRLIGTALLPTIKSISIEFMFDHDLSDLRNAGLILAHLLSFDQKMNSSCRLDEKRWKSKVLEKADEFNIIIEGISGLEKVLAEIRETKHSKYSNEERNEQSSTKYDLGHVDNCLLCYKNKPYSGVHASENLKAGLVRDWNFWTWQLEVHVYSQYQSVKVSSGCRPLYNGRIGGKFMM